MKRRSMIRLLSAVLLCALILCACGKRAPETSAAVSMLRGSGSFSAVADELGTQASGTVFVYEKDKNTYGVKIAASVQVGPEDWGGVAISLPTGCKLENVLCSYPDNGGEKPVNVWSTASENEKYTTVVEIARNRSQESMGGGSGTVVIDASMSADRVNAAGALPFGVECGAYVKNGCAILGAAWEEIAVEIGNGG